VLEKHDLEKLYQFEIKTVKLELNHGEQMFINKFDILNLELFLSFVIVLD
jgi:hypothetical protein